MSDFPQIFAFYSFKGGVGRSMAVLNLAYALAARQRNVLVLDMDLEAPGLSGFLHRKEEIAGFASRDMVDLVAWAASAALPLDVESFPPLADYAVAVQREKLEEISVGRDPGRLDIIPVEEGRSYYDRLASLTMGSRDQDALVRMGSVLRAWLKSLRFPIEVPEYYGPNAEREAYYDYVLVDSRTGITETGGLCIGPLSDQLVILTALNDQNVQGTRRFLEEVGILGRATRSADTLPAAEETLSRSEFKPYLVVASLVPAGEIETKRMRLEQLDAALGRVDVKLSYHPRLALSESIFTRDYRDEYLTREYFELLEQILRMAGDGDIQVPRESPFLHPRSPSTSGDALRLLVRSAPEASSRALLDQLIKTASFEEIKDETDLILWDRVYQVHSSSDMMDPSLRWRILEAWARLLSHWGSQTKDPELAKLRFDAALKKCEEMEKSPGMSVSEIASARLTRAHICMRKGDQYKAIHDYTFVLSLEEASTDVRAQALFHRGIAYSEIGERENTIADYTSLLSWSNAPVELKFGALVNRGVEYGSNNDPDKALTDFTSALMLNFESALTHMANPGKESNEALPNLIRPSSMSVVGSELILNALFNRAVTYFRRGDYGKAITDYTALLSLPKVPLGLRVRALINRGASYKLKGELEKAIIDYTSVLSLPGASGEYRVNALINRAVAYGQLGKAEEALADYGSVLTLPGATVEQRIDALVNRALVLSQDKEPEKAIAEWTSVLSLPDVPIERKANALLNRGWVHFVSGRIHEAIEDSRQSIILDPKNCTAHGNLALALLVSGKIHEAMASYDTAITLADSSDLKDMVDDLNKVIAERGPIAGADEALMRIKARRIFQP